MMPRYMKVFNFLADVVKGFQMVLEGKVIRLLGIKRYRKIMNHK